MNTEEFIFKARLVHGETYCYDQINYERCNKAVTIVCSKHGNFQQLPANHLSGYGCRLCGIDKSAGSKTYSADEFRRLVIERHSNKYTYNLENYRNLRSIITVTCPAHGNYLQKASDHLSGSGCRACSFEKLRSKFKSNTASFVEKAKQLHGSKYDYSLVNYGNNSSCKVVIVCKEHGKFEQTPAHHLNGQGCPTCSVIRAAKIKTLTKDEFESRAVEIHGHKYYYDIVDYVNHSTRVAIVCKEHGIFYQRPEYHLAGKGCPKCKQSYFEAFISELLNSLGVNYDTEVRFDSCRHVRPLPFDFCVHGNKLLIEYDGIQHFKPMRAWGGQPAFDTLKIRDAIKTAWAKDNGYNLLRLDYTMSREVIEQKIRETLIIKEVA